MLRTRHDGECPEDGNGTDYYGRCLGLCRECDEHLASTGRYTVYCPTCDTCSECGCPNADGFAHYADCAEMQEAEPEDDDEDEDDDDEGFVLRMRRA